MNLRFSLYSLMKTVRLATFAGTFERIPCFTSSVGELKNHAAIALPGIGIFVHPDDLQNIPLLRHEFGHMLQAKRWGKFFFYRSIAFASLMSALKSTRDSTHIHQHTWTEWSANKLSYDFLKQPADWDMKAYPIHPPEEGGKQGELPKALVTSN